jgi:hypothetical protein
MAAQLGRVTMASLEDFFPGGVVKFVAPPFDERYWAGFGVPARVRVDLWGGAIASGLAYNTRGVEAAGPGQRRTFGGSRKARGYASGESGKP